MAGERLLVVDDNPINVRLAQRLLAVHGYDVRTAGDADEALAAIAEFAPQVVLMDVQLPGMDGLELTRRLKADPQRAHMVIIALTAYAMKGDDERARAAGCDGYISKPIDTRSLPQLIESLVARGSAP
jgi:CheY-like chemotaxis protein